MRSAHTWKLAEELEKVQRRATNIVPSLANLNYEERLKKLKLSTLVYRILRGDLINVFKYVNGIHDTGTSLLHCKESNQTRGHCKKLKKMYTRTDLHHYFFPQRVIDWWNDLPEEIVKAGSVNEFKNHIDKHFKDHPVVFTYRVFDKPTAARMSVT